MTKEQADKIIELLKDVLKELRSSSRQPVIINNPIPADYTPWKPTNPGPVGPYIGDYPPGKGPYTIS